MSFTVRIGADIVPVEPGATVPVGFEIANRSDDPDRFEVSVEGLDPEWIAVPVPTFSVEARDIHQEKVFLKPPRQSESMAGDYPFVIKVRSLETGESRTVQAIVSVQAFNHLSMEISPKKGIISPFRKANRFEVTLMNLGNVEQTVQLRGSDPEDELTYDFEEQQLDLGPGQTKVVSVTPHSAKARPFSSVRLHGFQVTARSTLTPSLASSATAQLEERPVLSPGMLALGLLMLIVFAGWWLLLPKPPTLDSLSLDNENPMAGEVVHIRWKATNANGVDIRVNGIPIVQGGELEGEKTFTADVSGEVVGYAFRDSRQGSRVTRMFTVHVPPEVIAPKITRFDITPREVKLGQPILVQYEVAGAVTSLTLAPGGIALDPKVSQLKVIADVKGDIEYQLVAENQGKLVKKTVRVHVVEGSKASIVVFRSDVKTVPEGGGPVHITWQVTNAERVELSQDLDNPQTVGVQGERDISITGETEFTLTAYDDQGATVTQRIRIKVEPPSTDPPVKSGGGN
ncbi:MAG: hypothetical protein HZC36_16565 [Armatimonadetes bacterium]|nr:hypothetical protein [Armatimonadota bacterium]